MTIEVAIVGCGRFRITEAVFQQIRGVRKVEVGYAGGSLSNPRYEDVSRGTSGHAEVVRIHFDTAVVSFQNLLDVFFQIHNPCAADTYDLGLASPHRSVIFFQNNEQKRMALAAFKKIENVLKAPVTTELAPHTMFFLAEEEQHNYFKTNRTDLYSTNVIMPKVAASRQLFRKTMAA